MKKLISMIAICMAVIFSESPAQETDYTTDYSKEPGYIEFGDLSSLETSSQLTEVTLDEKMIKLAAGFSNKDNVNLKEALSGLKLIKVYTFGVNDKNRSYIENKIKSIEAELAGKKWDRIVRSRSNGSITNVYAKSSNDNVVGLVVTVMGVNGQTSFINIVGDIDVESLSRLSDQFNIPMLKGAGHNKSN